MTDHVYCSVCQSQGKQNKCYITGFNIKCGHDSGWARPSHKQAGSVLVCKCGCQGQNQLYITGYDIKCGHDNGWAYTQESQAQCTSCSKQLTGKWQMESNPSNSPYQTSKTGRYLGISDGYFLYSGNPNWVYSYCKPCWINQIKAILPQLGLDNYKGVQVQGQCATCLKDLSGNWQMESNPSNVSYHNCRTGRYLGISDGYFLYSGNPNWVYSYCKSCWINQIKSILPQLGIPSIDETQKNELTQQISDLQNRFNELKNENNSNKEQIIDLQSKIAQQQNNTNNQITENNILKELEVEYQNELNKNTQLQLKINEQLNINQEQKAIIENLTIENSKLKQNLISYQNQLKDLQNTCQQYQTDIEDLKKQQILIQKSDEIDQQNLNQISIQSGKPNLDFFVQNILNEMGVSNIKGNTIDEILILQEPLDKICKNLYDEIRFSIQKSRDEIHSIYYESVINAKENITNQLLDLEKNIDNQRQILGQIKIPKNVIEESIKYLIDYANIQKNKVVVSKGLIEIIEQLKNYQI